MRARRRSTSRHGPTVSASNPTIFPSKASSGWPMRSWRSNRKTAARPERASVRARRRLGGLLLLLAHRQVDEAGAQVVLEHFAVAAPFDGRAQHALRGGFVQAFHQQFEERLLRKLARRCLLQAVAD